MVVTHYTGRIPSNYPKLMNLDYCLFHDLKEAASRNVILEMFLDDKIEDDGKMVLNPNKYSFGNPALIQRTLEQTMQEGQPCPDRIEKDFNTVFTATRKAIV